MQEVNIGHYQDNLCPLGRAASPSVIGLSGCSKTFRYSVLCSVLSLDKNTKHHRVEMGYVVSSLS